MISVTVILGVDCRYHHPFVPFVPALYVEVSLLYGLVITELGSTYTLKDVSKSIPILLYKVTGSRADQTHLLEKVELWLSYCLEVKKPCRMEKRGIHVSHHVVTKQVKACQSKPIRHVSEETTNVSPILVPDHTPARR